MERELETLSEWDWIETTAANTSRWSSMIPCATLHHAHVKMTPKDAQMAFPILAPKTPSAPNDSS